MPASKYEKIFPSEIYGIKGIIKEILAFIRDAFPMVTEDDMFEIRLIFMELICNAVIHGNKQDIRKNVNVNIEILQNTIHTRIVDEGIGFDYLKLLNSLEKENETDHGRGIKLVYSLTDSLIFNTLGNEINFYKRVVADEQSTGG